MIYTYAKIPPKLMGKPLPGHVDAVVAGENREKGEKAHGTEQQKRIDRR